MMELKGDIDYQERLDYCYETRFKYVLKSVGARRVCLVGQDVTLRIR